MDLKEIKKIYFIGIGGIGMSAVAGIAKSLGYEVSGSDSSDIYDPAKSVLDRGGIKYTAGYAAENFLGADLVVVTGAVGTENPELQKAQELGIEIVSYPQLLGALAAQKRRIVVVGTHGKGTTSGLLGFILKSINDSSFFVGGVLTQLGVNFHFGNGPEFVLEGDEYRASTTDQTPKFMYYHPDVLLINNLELDHPDLYPDLEKLKKVFGDLVRLVPESGLIVYNADDQNVVELVRSASVHTIGFGFKNPEAEIKATEIQTKTDSLFQLRVFYKNEQLDFESIFPGKIYAYNNLAAISVLLALGYKPGQFAQLVKEYRGLKRRFEIISDGEVALIDDYAHHPTAVFATLQAAKQKFPNRRLIAVFEPHTFSRTREVLPQLAQSFDPADLILISEIYPAREQKLPDSITGRQVAEEIGKHHQNVFFVPNQTAAQQKIKEISKAGDAVVVMSVGPYKAI